MRIFRRGLAFVLFTVLAARGSQLAPDPSAAYRGRIHEALVWRASLVKKDQPANNQVEVASKLALNEDLDWCSQRVVQLMKDPNPFGNMFWMFPNVTVAFLGRDKLSVEARQAIRKKWRTYMPMRGDTENHWAMYYTTLYLMSELYPGEPGSTWYTGKSSAENLAEARDYLVHWMDITTARGQGEYDCTQYLGEYCISMLLLATWADDPAMRQRGRMMLDYLLADYAVDSLNGMYVGAHARTDDTQVLEKWNGLSSFFGWLFFGNCPPPSGYGTWGIFFAATASVSSYELPEVIYRIATDRDTPYLSRELKRTSYRWRNTDEHEVRVYKTTYMTKDYAVGSDQGGILQPVQQHSWDVTWAVADPRGAHNTLFSLNPYYSVHALQMYLNEMPDALLDSVRQNARPSYLSGDKFLSGSPYEQVFQQDDTVVALYDIAPGTTFEHVNGFFSKDLARLEEDPSGWIFVQGGRTFIAYYPLAPYEWRPMKDGDRRLYSPHLRNGTIVQAAPMDKFASWDAFKQAIRALPLKVQRDPKPRVEFTTLRGRRLVCAYGENPLVDGQPVEYAKWPLFESPYLHAAPGSHKLVLTHGRLTRVLDFNTLSITDRVAP